jgi:hypothetical protein
MRALDVREEPEPAVNVSRQPDLFGAPAEPLLGEPAALSIGSIGGLEVHIERPCRHCGATIATIIEGKGPHTAALACACCGGFRQWLSHACCMFLIEFVVRCGRPTEPIRIFEQVNRTT